MSVLKERYELTLSRIRKWKEETAGTYASMIRQTAELFERTAVILEGGDSRIVTEEWNRELYREIAGTAYETSYANPAYAVKEFGGRMGEYLCWYYNTFRDSIQAAYEKEYEQVVIRMELFLQMISILTEEEEKERFLKENLYYFIHDYEEERMEKNIRRMLCPEDSRRIVDIVMESNLADTDYLYRYGLFVTENEKKMASFLASLPEETLWQMALTYTEGYRKGFEIAGIDLSQKRTVQICYHIGFEPMVRQAVRQFRDMGLEPVFSMKANGVESTPPNRQYIYDHRFDDALYLNRAVVQGRLALEEKLYEKYRKEASFYAGPAVIEVFGEALFVPENKPESPSYTKEQEKLSVEYRREFAIIQNRYIPQDSYSFTIIAYPIPEIGEEFEAIFKATVDVNTLDAERYREIQQALCDALDQGESVKVTGRNGNITDLRIQLHRLEDPHSQTNFENCLADVNIPVGEVFTSPVLKGTEGTLHVKKVYLNGLRYENLTFTFQDGMVTDYTCSNYESEQENRKYIKENVLKNRDSLPMGEFAIGTNTTAFRMGRRFDIEAKLPILIAEKTGPHFALGDTCYAMSEEVVLHNPDGKEIVAKDNECSLHRHTDVSKAYFNCHTDVTIPYDELGDIVVCTYDGKEIVLIRDGQFVLPGTESLNDALEDEMR